MSERLRVGPTAEWLFTPVFIALGVADLCYFTGFGIAIFALPLVTGPVGGGAALAGLTFGAFAMSAFVLRPFVGRLSDLHGRRPFLVGVAEAAFFVAGFAALADVAPTARLGEALSYNSLGLYLSIAFGPPLGEILVRTVGFGLAWAGAAALAALAAGLCLILGETRAGPPPDGAVHHLIHRPALPILVGFLASLVAMGGFLAFASLYGVRLGLANASLSLLILEVATSSRDEGDQRSQGNNCIPSGRGPPGPRHEGADDEPPITSQSTVATLVDHWLQQLRAEERLESTTINEYERVIRKLVVPSLGSMTLREVTTVRINGVLADLGAQSQNSQRKAQGRDGRNA